MMELLHLAWPHFSILFTACLVLCWGLFRPENASAGVYTIALAGISLTLGGLACHNTVLTVGLYGQFITDALARFMLMGILSVVLGVFVYGAGYLKTYQLPVTETIALMLFSTFGMMVLVCANTLLTTFLGIELLSLPLYALTAMRRTHAGASEAALKYFIMGAMASGLLLYGFSLLYGLTGQMMFQSIAMTLSTSSQQLPQGLVLMAVVFVIAGLCFKLAAVPFHMWAPDVYEGAPLAVTLLISSAPKIAGLTILLRFLTTALPAEVVPWKSMIVLIALLSVVFGNICAIVQTNIRRLLAYSAISHSGFILLGVSCASAIGYSSAVYYLFVYMLMTVAAFGVLTLLSREGLELEDISELKGLNSERPWAAFMFMVVLLAMAGVPPTAGFFVKFAVLRALIDSHQIGLAIVAVLMAVIGAFYYLWIIKTMYFDKKEYMGSFELGGVLGRAVFSINCLALVYFGIFPAGLMTACASLFGAEA